jgi:hypothetical protein
MDLNYLLKRQQEERSRATAAVCEASRIVHEAMAVQFENEIRRLTDGRVNLFASASKA